MAKAKKKDQSDYGTPESAQHGTFVLEETIVAGVKRRKNISYDQLAKLHSAGKVTDRQKATGEAYAELVYSAGRAGNPKCANWNAIGGTREESDKIIRDIQALDQADRHIGPLRNVIRYVCVEGHTPVEWEEERPNATARNGHGLFYLKEALDYLADFWKR